MGGMFIEDITFHPRAPELPQIVDKIVEIAGLPLKVEPWLNDSGNMYDLNARIEFEGFPSTRLEISAYRPGAIREQLERDGLADSPMMQLTLGAQDDHTRQTVYVHGYTSQEPTLLFVIVLALEALGGRADNAISDDERRKYGQRLTPSELSRRIKHEQRKGTWMLLAAVVFLPLIVPMWIVGSAWQVACMLWRLPKIRQAMASQAHAKRPPENRA